MSSVVSNVSASAPSTSSSDTTLRTLPGHERASTSTKITIHGYLPTSNHSRQASSGSGAGRKESVLVHLHPQSHTLASEWLDGLLMLLNQQPITADTNKLVTFIGGYGLKIRLLNVRYEDVGLEEPILPSREGLDDEYYCKSSKRQMPGLVLTWYLYPQTILPELEAARHACLHMFGR